MPTTLSECLPEPISPENERAIMAFLRQKLTRAANVGVMLLHAMERRFGPEAREAIKDMIAARTFPPRPNPGDPAEDLRRYCAEMDRSTAGFHQMRRVIDEPDRIGYAVTSCMWAEIYRELGEPELGRVFCAGDGPALKAYHPGLGFKRTKTCMGGDGECDHLYYVRKPGMPEPETPRQPS